MFLVNLDEGLLAGTISSNSVINVIDLATQQLVFKVLT